MPKLQPNRDKIPRSRVKDRLMATKDPVLTYRPDVDGLRAVAVLSVVFYHTDLALFSGGYVGVDVFFVISGFLITGIIVGEVADRRFSIANFYERRVRRIFPALFATLLVTFAVSTLLLLPLDFVNLAKSGVATTAFASNFYFWNTSEYFAPATEFNPLLHTWSLAVEEQFYIFHPLFLVLVLRYAQRWLAPFLAAGFVVSFGYCIWITANNPETAFYLIPSRAWELFLGSLLAIGAVPAIPTRLRSAEAALGIGFITLAVVGFTDRTAFPGSAALLPCLGSALIIHAGQSGGSLTARMLSSKPVVFVGLISYSLYLWHWPVLAIAKYFFVSTQLPRLVVVCALILSTVLAILSWRYVERPFRYRKNFDRVSIFSAGLGAMAVTLLSCTLIIVSSGFPGRLSDATLALAAASRDMDWTSRTCLKMNIDQVLVDPTCLIGKGDADDITFILWGDSHAGALMPAVSKAALDTGRSGVFIGRSACPPLLRVTRPLRGAHYECVAFNDTVLELIRANESLGTVLLAARWGLSTEGVRYQGEAGSVVFIADDQSNQIGFEENRAVFHRGLERTLSELRALGRQVVLVGPVPEVGWNVPQALAMQSHTGIQRTIRPTREAFHDRQAFVIETMATLGPAYGATIVLPHESLCSEEPCRIESGGRPLYRDDDHLSQFGARAISSLFEPILAP